MDEPLLFGREREVHDIAERIQSPGTIVELIAPPGTGKTSLLKAVAAHHSRIRGGATEYLHAGGGFSLASVIDIVADRFRENSGHNLLIIDGADDLDASDTLEAIKRLETGPWEFSSILAGHRDAGLGSIFSLQPLNRHTLGELLGEVIHAPLDAAMLDRLWKATRGNPAIARELREFWRKGRTRDPAALARLLEPWTASGLIDQFGRPLKPGGAEEAYMLADVQIVTRSLIERIGSDPGQLFAMASHEFEELVAELLRSNGYEISMTPRTRDGGKDMYAARRDRLGSFLYVVECKRNAPDRAVGIEVVRALHGVAQHERVNAGILLTTSSFSGPARAFASEVSNQLSLRDYFDLREWIDDYQRR